MDWLKQLAPTLGTLLGGPFGGIAVTALGAAFGMKDATQKNIKDILDAGNLSGDQIAAIKKAELDAQNELQRLDVQLEQIAANDRDSARKMFSETKTWMPSILSVLITIGFFGMLTMLQFREIPVGNKEVTLTTLGSLGTAWIACISYWFGTTRGADKQTDQLVKNMSTPS